MTTKLITHKVLRAICIGGERIEPDTLVDLGPVLGAELRNAAKVEIYTGDETGQAQAADRATAPPAEPAPKVRKPAKPEPEAAQ